MGGGATGGDPKPMTPEERVIPMPSRDSALGAVAPHDVRTVLTRSFDEDAESLRTIHAEVQMAVKQVPTTGTVAVGTVVAFDINRDAFGDPIPNKIQITRIQSIPAVGEQDPVQTIRRIRLFRKSTRNIAEIIYSQEDVYLNNDLVIDTTSHEYVNQDGTNRIMGTMEVRAGGNPAAFTVTVFFR